MTERLKGLVPMARVQDVPRSIAFYEQLGFKVENTVEDDASSTGRTSPGTAPA